MKCKNVENRIIDFLEGSLSNTEMQLVKKHLTTCNHCTKIHDETKELLEAFLLTEKAIPSENLNPSFFSMLEEEKQLQSETNLSKPIYKLSWKNAFQIAASIALLLTGYFLGNYSQEQHTQKEIAVLQHETQLMKQNMLLALIDNRSPSKRIKAVNFTEEFEKPDTKILEALIDRLHYDSNSNVRLAAVEALTKFSNSELVKIAFIKALTNEENPSIQLEIMAVLVAIQEKRALVPMRKLLEQPETPSYVKNQATIGISQLI